MLTKEGSRGAEEPEERKKRDGCGTRLERGRGGEGRGKERKRETDAANAQRGILKERERREREERGGRGSRGVRVRHWQLLFG